MLTKILVLVSISLWYNLSLEKPKSISHQLMDSSSVAPDLLLPQSIFHAPSRRFPPFHLLFSFRLPVRTVTHDLLSLSLSWPISLLLTLSLCLSPPSAHVSSLSASVGVTDTVTARLLNF